MALSNLAGFCGLSSRLSEAIALSLLNLSVGCREILPSGRQFLVQMLKRVGEGRQTVL